jgi:hypothetical protein
VEHIIDKNIQTGNLYIAIMEQCELYVGIMIEKMEYQEGCNYE